MAVLYMTLIGLPGQEASLGIAFSGNGRGMRKQAEKVLPLLRIRALSVSPHSSGKSKPRGQTHRQRRDVSSFHGREGDRVPISQQ